MKENKQSVNKIPSCNEVGFTLIEMVVVVAVLAIVITTGISVFVSVSQSAERANLLEQLRYEGLRILDQIEREVKQAKNVESLDGNTTLRISSDLTGSDCIQYNFFAGDVGTNGYLTQCQGFCSSFDAPGLTDKTARNLPMIQRIVDLILLEHLSRLFLHPIVLKILILN